MPGYAGGTRQEWPLAPIHAPLAQPNNHRGEKLARLRLCPRRADTSPGAIRRRSAGISRARREIRSLQYQSPVHQNQKSVLAAYSLWSPSEHMYFYYQHTHYKYCRASTSRGLYHSSRAYAFCENAGVQRAAALCRSARCPRKNLFFSCASRRRRRVRRTHKPYYNPFCYLTVSPQLAKLYLIESYISGGEQEE